jgi:hypothetical protein
MTTATRGLSSVDSQLSSQRLLALCRIPVGVADAQAGRLRVNPSLARLDPTCFFHLIFGTIDIDVQRLQRALEDVWNVVVQCLQPILRTFSGLTLLARAPGFPWGYKAGSNQLATKIMRDLNYQQTITRWRYPSSRTCCIRGIG